jgi:histidinol-phosphate/aromatic aminotransferase/cobyric acid decarboxylase-like protein
MQLIPCAKDTFVGPKCLEDIMKVEQSERGLFEKGFDDDLPQERLEKIVELFPDSETVTDLLVELRELDSFTDMKRGELYPEVIGGVTRLRRTIASVYELDIVQAQPNFSCNGCIDTFLSHIQRLELTDTRRNGFMVATPTYFRYYHKVEALRLKLMPIPVLKDHQYPLAQLMDALKAQRPSCLILVTPNNPTGIPIPDEQMFQILDNVPDDLNVAIDRTCANIEPEVSTKSLLKKYPHKRLVIFHSFSKYYSMSHLRIGFSVFSNSDLATEVNRYLPFGLNLEALLKATYTLSTRGELKPSAEILNNIRANKRLMSDFLARHPEYSCTDFKSNYAVFFLPEQINSREFHRRLQNKGISVMPGHDLPEPDDYSIRLHVGGKPVFLERMINTIESWE